VRDCTGLYTALEIVLSGFFSSIGVSTVDARLSTMPHHSARGTNNTPHLSTSGDRRDVGSAGCRSPDRELILWELPEGLVDLWDQGLFDAAS